MKRKFYCDIYEGSAKDIWMNAISNIGGGMPTLQKNCRRVEFFVDLPDECFVQSIEVKKVSESAVVQNNL